MNNLPLWFLPLLCLIVMFALLVKIPIYIRNPEPIVTREHLDDIKINFENLHRINNEQEQF